MNSPGQPSMASGRAIRGAAVFTLTCNKTGRFWRHRTEAMARRAALHLGLSDYTIDEQGNA